MLETATKRSLAAVAVLALVLRGGIHAESEAHDHGREGPAYEVWKGFLDHLRALGREDLIPAQADEETFDLATTDPVRGVLFRLSGDLIELDALFSEPGRTLDADGRARAAALAARLSAAEDPYLKAYGDYFGARLDIERGEAPRAVRTLTELLRSPHFLPRRAAQKELAAAYRAAGDPTLAILELQLILAGLPPEAESERAWAKEELRKVRAASGLGPLAETGGRMASISELLRRHEVGGATQDEERRVEDVLVKIAALLEAERCPNCGTPKCPDCGRKRCPCELLPGKP
jgi:tetratricopeptide (TPR) repeat protein